MSKKNNEVQHDYDVYEELLLSWIAGYDHAIYEKRKGILYKDTLDDAAHWQMKEITAHLEKLGMIFRNADHEFLHTEECVQLHLEHLKEAGLWEKGFEEPIHIHETDHKDVDYFDIPKCSYAGPCSWHTNKSDFSDLSKYPCQRLGTFRGAVLEYADSEATSKNVVGYFMTQVLEEDGCRGYLYMVPSHEIIMIIQNPPKPDLTHEIKETKNE